MIGLNRSRDTIKDRSYQRRHHKRYPPSKTPVFKRFLSQILTLIPQFVYNVQSRMFWTNWHISEAQKTALTLKNAVGKHRVREQRNIFACFLCKWVPFVHPCCHIFWRSAVPLCLWHMCLWQSFSDPTDLTDLFSICFSNSLASTKMNLLAWRGIIVHLKN